MRSQLLRDSEFLRQPSCMFTDHTNVREIVLRNPPAGGSKLDYIIRHEAEICTP